MMVRQPIIRVRREGGRVTCTPERPQAVVLRRIGEPRTLPDGRVVRRLAVYVALMVAP